MSAKNSVTVVISGKVTRLSGYESEEYLQKVASYLNHKIGDLHEIKGYNLLTADTKNTLLALNVADDYFKAKRQVELYEEDLQVKDKELYDLKRELVELQMQLDEVRRSGRGQTAGSYPTRQGQGGQKR